MLERDIILDFKSFSMPDGHAGTEVKFIASDRVVLQTSYCTRNTEKLTGKEPETTTNTEKLSIPDCIHTEEELRDYVQKHKPLWLPPVLGGSQLSKQCRATFRCPRCGCRFERYGADLSDIKFGTCARCGYPKKKFKGLLGWLFK